MIRVASSLRRSRTSGLFSLHCCRTFSEAELLRPWLRRFQPQHTHVLIPHQGKGSLPANPDTKPDPKRSGLLDQLPAKLRAFGKGFDPATDRVLVLVDADDDDCVDLKERLTKLLAACTPAAVAKFRIAVEETEAFYLGDLPGIRSAFGSLAMSPYNAYVQDSVCGTWEVFAKVIRASREDKVDWARRMSATLGTDTTGPAANRSPSFLAFCNALRELAGEPVAVAAPAQRVRTSRRASR